MDKININERLDVSFCHKCGREYNGVPALSRVDGAPICPDCGTREALDSIGICPDEQEKIIETIHRSCSTPMNRERV